MDLITTSGVGKTEHETEQNSTGKYYCGVGEDFRLETSLVEVGLILT